MKKIEFIKHQSKRERIRSLWKLLRSENFQSWVALVIVSFMFLGSSQTMAQDPSELPSSIDPSIGYENIEANKVNAGFDPNVLDNWNDSGNEMVSLLGNVVLSVEPSVGPNYQTMLEQYPDLDGFARKGLNGTLHEANMAILYNPPSTDVVAHLANEWVPGYDQAYTSVLAQDGFAVLEGINIADLWETTRLLSYTLFVIALIVAGFMIMFRHKIGGQMAVTIFNTIPRVIVGLILVTFSFAIVGIIIDFGALMINVFAGVLNLDNPIVVGDPFSLVGLLFRGSDGIGNSGFAGWAGIGTSLALIGVGALTSFTGVGLVAAGGGVLTLILTLVVIGITAYASLKVFITLMKAYIGIILDTVLAPIFLFMSVLPGKNSIAWDWFWRVVKNVLTFAVVFLIINLAMYLHNAGVDYRFPEGLAGGDLSDTSGGGMLSAILAFLLPLFFFFTAAEAPNFIADLLPAPGGGKGTSTAFGNVQKSFGKIPVVGGFFG